MIVKLLKSMVPLTEVFDIVNSNSHSLVPLKFSTLPPAKKEEIVESSHPLQKDYPFQTKTVTLSNTRSVAIYFDRKSKLSPSDTLKISSSSDDVTIVGSEFPPNPLIVDSGSVTFSLKW